MEIKNYGINWKRESAARSDKDYKYIRGISPISIFAIPPDLREVNLPVGERQNIGEEKFDCVSRAVCNWAEDELDYAYANNVMNSQNKKWVEDNGYLENGKIVLSDVWVALGSGTTREGNSLKDPIDFARKNGMIPKKLLPQLNGFDENYDPKRITTEMKSLGKEFSERFIMNYEQVSELQFSINTDGLIVALYAWLPPVDGIYQRNELEPNHSVYRFIKIVNHSILDNYDVNGIFIKYLAPNFNFMDYGYRLYFVSQKEEPKIQATIEKKNIFSGLIGILRNFWKCLAIGGIILVSAAGIYGNRHTEYRNYPNYSLTPGLIRTNDIQDICGHNTGTYRKTTEAMKNKIYQEYGIKSHPQGSYEIDHDIPLGIGGADDIKNLWPQPNPEFHQKDIVENKLRIDLCNGIITQKEAINNIKNWVDYYDKNYKNKLGSINEKEDQDDIIE